MENRVALNQRLEAWLKQHNYTPRRLSLEAGCGEGQVRRILESTNYSPQSDTWRKLARTMGWDEREVLALAGLAPEPLPEQDEPLTIIRRELRRLGLGDAEVAAVITLIESVSRGRLTPEVAPN